MWMWLSYTWHIHIRHWHELYSKSVLVLKHYKKKSFLILHTRGQCKQALWGCPHFNYWRKEGNVQEDYNIWVVKYLYWFGISTKYYFMGPAYQISGYKALIVFLCFSMSCFFMIQSYGVLHCWNSCCKQSVQSLPILEKAGWHDCPVSSTSLGTSTMLGKGGVGKGTATMLGKVTFPVGRKSCGMLHEIWWHN